MAEHSTEGEAQHQGGGMPPWINVFAQQQTKWRDGDIVCSVPAKSGTTWSMNIVHQLREGGDPNFEDIYIELKWLEFAYRPGMTSEDIMR